MKTIIIAGCTRSGLTLMMQILNKGGYPCVGTYPAFEDYGVGGVDFEKAKGHAVKLVDTHNQYPPEGEYHVVRLRRDLEQQAKSIIKFLRVMGLRIHDREWIVLKDSLIEDYQVIDDWAKKQEAVMYVDFEVLVKNPAKILEMLSGDWDIQLNANAIDCVIERDTDCYDGMLELQLINSL